jgi:nucleotide-binding universal stress UspA family protein
MIRVKVLLAMSGKSISERTVARAEQLLSLDPNNRLTVLHVSKGRASFYQKSKLGSEVVIPEDERQRVHALETYVSRRFAPWYGRVKFRHEIGDPAAVICKVAQEEGSDLILISHHHGFTDKVPVGGVTRAVLSDARCDVLVVS